MASIYNDGTYLKNNSDWHLDNSPYKASLVAKAISRSGASFNSCVDVGCGAGMVTKILSSQFPQKQFFGYDISRDATIFWNDSTGHNVQFKLVNLLETKDKFDLAICLDVFEHVEDYIGFLKSLRNHAEQFVFNIPLDMNVIKLVTGLRSAREDVGHLHYFNAYTAIATLEHCGYQIQDQFLSAGFKASRPTTFKQALVMPVRLLMTVFGSKIAAKWFGGYSLVVTAKS